MSLEARHMQYGSMMFVTLACDTYNTGNDTCDTIEVSKMCDQFNLVSKGLEVGFNRRTMVEH
jgi:hypothetical protein